MGTKQYDNYADLITFTRASRGTALRPVSYGEELVTNGTFDTDISGWTDNSSAGGSIAWNAAGYLDVINATGTARTYENVVVESGKVYEISFDVPASTSVAAFFYLGSTSNNADIFSGVAIPVGSYSFKIAAISNLFSIGFRNFSAGTTVSLDNVSVKEVIFDRADDPLTLFNHPNNVPRIEYDADGNRLGLLIEEQRTNLVTYSSEFDNAAWTKENSSVTANATTSPDGTLTAYKIVENTSSGSHGIIQTPTVTASVSNTRSFYLKAGERTWARVNKFDGVSGAGANFNLATGQVGTVQAGATASIEDVGNGWYKCSVTATAQPSAVTDRAQVSPIVNDSTVSYTGDGTSGIYVWGAQLEEGSFATSYIPTSGSTATRSADIASIPTSAFGYNADKAGTIYCEHQSVSSINQRSVSVNDGTLNNCIQTVVSTSGGSALVGEIRSGGSTQAFTPGTTPIVEGQLYKIAIAYAENDVAVSRDGVLGTDSSADIPNVSNLVIGAATSSLFFLNGHIKSIQYYPRRLTNSQIQELTS